MTIHVPSPSRVARTSGSSARRIVFCAVRNLYGTRNQVNTERASSYTAYAARIAIARLADGTRIQYVAMSALQRQWNQNLVLEVQFPHDLNRERRLSCVRGVSEDLVEVATARPCSRWSEGLASRPRYILPTN